MCGIFQCSLVPAGYRHHEHINIKHRPPAGPGVWLGGMEGRGAEGEEGSRGIVVVHTEIIRGSIPGPQPSRVGNNHTRNGNLLSSP